jgi:excisionase family DNA binding protein
MELCHSREHAEPTSGKENRMPEQRATFTVKQSAKFIGVSDKSAYEAVRRGEIPSIRIGRRILVPRQALEDMLAGRAQ